MKKTIKVADCPGCGALVPLDGAGKWVPHQNTLKNAQYECVGAGEAPFAENIQERTVTDEPEEPA